MPRFLAFRLDPPQEIPKNPPYGTISIPSIPSIPGSARPMSPRPELKFPTNDRNHSKISFDLIRNVVRSGFELIAAQFATGLCYLCYLCY